MAVWAEREERLELSKVEAESSETQQAPPPTHIHTLCWVHSGGSTLAECSQVILKTVCKSENSNGNKYTCYRCVPWFVPMSLSYPTVMGFASGYCCGVNIYVLSKFQYPRSPEPQKLLFNGIWEQIPWEAVRMR